MPHQFRIECMRWGQPLHCPNEVLFELLHFIHNVDQFSLWIEKLQHLEGFGILIKLNMLIPIVYFIHCRIVSFIILHTIIPVNSFLILSCLAIARHSEGDLSSTFMSTPSFGGQGSSCYSLCGCQSVIWFYSPFQRESCRTPLTMALPLEFVKRGQSATITP